MGGGLLNWSVGAHTLPRPAKSHSLPPGCEKGRACTHACVCVCRLVGQHTQVGSTHRAPKGHTLIPSPLTSVRDSSKLMQSHTTSDCSAAILQICSGGGRECGWWAVVRLGACKGVGDGGMPRCTHRWE